MRRARLSTNRPSSWACPIRAARALQAGRRAAIPGLQAASPLLHSGDLDFSFAGLKTAVLTQAKKLGDELEARKADLAASTQAAIVDVLVKKTMTALKQTGMKRVVVAGGVGPTSSCASSSMKPAPSTRFACITPSCICAPTTAP
jgi:tRNA A37 threonylcarbamoyltransferase TsaD